MSINPPAPLAVQGTLGAAEAQVRIDLATSWGAVSQPVGRVVVQLVGTFSGTVTLEATVDGTNWVSLWGNVLATGTAAATLTAAGALQAVVPSVVAVRARMSTYTSGSCVATMRFTTGS
jgi:hypothetical protein